MDFLGIGPLELLFILVIIIVVVGPRDIQKTARTLGRSLNALYKSEGWKAFTDVSKQLRDLPNRLAREAELEEVQRAAREVKGTLTAADPNLAAWTPDGKRKSGIAPTPANSPVAAEVANAEAARGNAASPEVPTPSPADPAGASTGTASNLGDV